MQFFKSLFNRAKDKKGLKLKFSKEENTWQVMNGYSIVYVGEKEKCQRYLNHLKLMG